MDEADPVLKKLFYAYNDSKRGEMVYYDSQIAHGKCYRNFCCPQSVKYTSKRIIYSDWNYDEISTVCCGYTPIEKFLRLRREKAQQLWLEHHEKVLKGEETQERDFSEFLRDITFDGGGGSGDGGEHHVVYVPEKASCFFGFKNCLAWNCVKKSFKTERSNGRIGLKKIGDSKPSMGSWAAEIDTQIDKNGMALVPWVPYCLRSCCRCGQVHSETKRPMTCFDVFPLGFFCNKTMRWGRRIDQFPSVIIQDIVASQNCCQIMSSGAGSVYLKKVGGIDTSDSRQELVITDVPRVMYFYDYVSLVVLGEQVAERGTARTVTNVVRAAEQQRAQALADTSVIDVPV